MAQGHRSLLVVRHLKRIFGEGQLYMCEYTEKLVREQEIFGGEWGKMSVEKYVDSPWNGNNRDESVCSTFPFLLSSAYQPPAEAVPCQALVLNPLKAPLLLW